MYLSEKLKLIKFQKSFIKIFSFNDFLFILFITYILVRLNNQK